MLILNACCPEYLPRTQALVRSIIMNTIHKILVLTVNCDLGIRNRQIESFSQDMDFKSVEWKKDYLANIRAQMFHICLITRKEKSFLWLDSDSLVRGPLDELADITAKNMTCAVDTAQEFKGSEPNQALISTVGVANTDEGLAFTEEWARQLEKIRREPGYNPSIMSVQTAYFRASRRWQHGFYDLTYKWSDKHMTDESPIWEGQGPRKHTNEKYLNEERKYAL